MTPNEKKLAELEDLLEFLEAETDSQVLKENADPLTIKDMHRIVNKALKKLRGGKFDRS